MSAYFLWLALFLAISLAGYLAARRNALVGRTLMAVGAIGCGVLVIRQVYQVAFGGAGRPMDRSIAAAAYYLGHELLGQLPSLEGDICLILPPDSSANQAVLDTAFDTFARVLAPLPTLRLKEASLRTKLRLVEEGRVPNEAFEQALQQVPDAIAYVSFAGVPSDVKRLSLCTKTNPVPFLVFDPSGGRAWAEMIDQGRIRCVVVPRSELEGGLRGAAIGPPDEIFKERFLMFRSPNGESASRGAPTP